MTAAAPRVLLVGHCTPDSWLLQNAVTRIWPAATVSRANDGAELQARLPDSDLLLVNRSLDGRFDSKDGVELIGSLAASNGPPAVMLISNYPEAQSRAVAAGAVQGFGKDSVYSESAAKLLREALGKPA